MNFVSEIVVIDSGSTDKTLSILKKYKNVKTYYHKFENYASQKNYALSKCKHDWILSLDADEEVSAELKNEILNLPAGTTMGYFIPRMTRYLGKWIKHSGWYPNYQMRFFNRKHGKFSGMYVHETVDIDGEIKYLKSPLLHYSYKNISSHIQSINKYTDLVAQEKVEKGKCSSIILSILEGLWKFFQMYIFRLGFIDGKPGLVIAILGGFYNFLKYIKLYEKCRKKS